MKEATIKSVHKNSFIAYDVETSIKQAHKVTILYVNFTAMYVSKSLYHEI